MKDLILKLTEAELKTLLFVLNNLYKKNILSELNDNNLKTLAKIRKKLLSRIEGKIRIKNYRKRIEKKEFHGYV